jgi:hypothetical protein
MNARRSQRNKEAQRRRGGQFWRDFQMLFAALNGQEPKTAIKLLRYALLIRVADKNGDARKNEAAIRADLRKFIRDVRRDIETELEP